MNFQTNTIASTFDERAGYNSMQNSRSEQRSASSVGTHSTGGFLGVGTTQVSNVDTVSIVGMNITKVKEVRDAIDNYCTEIETYINQLDPTADSRVAFKSDEVKKALEAYMEKVTAYCVNLVSQLRAFSDKIADAQNQWEAATREMAGTIASNANSYSVGSKYQETIQSPSGSFQGATQSVGSNIQGDNQSGTNFRL